MRIGLLYLNEIKYDDFAWVFAKDNIDAEIIDTGVSVYSTDKEDSEKVSGMIREQSIDVAITMDFCAAVSDACLECGIKYVAWINDAPQQALFNKQIRNDCNYIFSFDKNQLSVIKELGAPNAFYMPLATNVMRNAGLVINEEDIHRYTCDVSFIGSLYHDDEYSKVYMLACDATKLEIDRILATAFGIWDGSNHLNNKLSDSAVSELAKLCNYSKKDEFSMPEDDYLVGKLLSRKLAFDERVAIAKMLSNYDFRLYTNSQNMSIDGVDLWPPLSYDEELPKAYHLSRINLNITLHTITSGIPLRVFDIMGVGGFMLTNYQPEIDDLFSVGQDIEVYRNIEELGDKVRYYLINEDKRTKIALNGYQTVSEKYNYESAFNKIARAMGITI